MLAAWLPCGVAMAAASFMVVLNPRSWVKYKLRLQETSPERGIFLAYKFLRDWPNELAKKTVCFKSNGQIPYHSNPETLLAEDMVRPKREVFQKFQKPLH